MKTASIHLGKIFGIPVGLDYSWFLIFALITWSLASGYFPSEFKGWPVAEYWSVAAAAAILLFVSVLLHELGHSVVALRYKVPVRSITLFIFGGVAQIASEPPSAMSEFWIAIAGPLVSFALGGIFAVLQRLVSGVAPLLALAKYLAYLNGVLGLFNLIPGFPLDGGRVFRAIVWGLTNNYRRATQIAASLGRLISFVFIFFGVWQMFSGNFTGGLWIAFIGWFLESAANAQLQQQMIHDLLDGHSVAQALSRNFVTISPEMTLQRLADEIIFRQGRRCFFVMDGDRMVGLLTLHNVKEIPRDEWPEHIVAERMIPISKVHIVSPDLPVIDALKLMDENGVNQLPVMADGRVLGVLSRESLIHFMHTMQEMYHSQTPHHLPSGAK